MPQLAFRLRPHLVRECVSWPARRNGWQPLRLFHRFLDPLAELSFHRSYSAWLFQSRVRSLWVLKISSARNVRCYAQVRSVVAAVQLTCSNESPLFFANITYIYAFFVPRHKLALKDAAMRQ